MTDLFGNHIVGFPTRRLIYFYLRANHDLVRKSTPGDLQQVFNHLTNKYFKLNDIHIYDRKLLDHQTRMKYSI